MIIIFTRGFPSLREYFLNLIAIIVKESITVV